jgi:FkbM family methyltransferase
MADYLQAFEEAIAFARADALHRAAKKPLEAALYWVAPPFRLFVPVTVSLAARTVFGERMTVVFPESVPCKILCYGGVEEEVTFFLLKCLRPGMTFIDVGAHFGYFTLLASKLVEVEGQAHSFEPCGSSFKILEGNVAEKPNIRIQRQGLWSGPASLSFFDYGPKYSPHNGFFALRDLQAREISRVLCATLDNYCAQFGVAPDFIKININAELSEFHILQGGQVGNPGTPSSDFDGSGGFRGPREWKHELREDFVSSESRL